MYRRQIDATAHSQCSFCVAALHAAPRLQEKSGVRRGEEIVDKGGEDGGGKWPPVTHKVGTPNAAAPPLPTTCRPAHMRNTQTISVEKATKGRVRTTMTASPDRLPRGRLAVTASAAATNAMRIVMASHASPFAISEASGIGIPKTAAPLPVGWRGTAGEVQGNAGGILID